MSSSAGLLLDENVADETAAYLRRMGLDVVTVKEAGLAGVEDPEVAQFATETGRVLVTFNYDFANMTSVFPSHVPGIIRLRVSRQAPEVVNSVLGEFLNVHSISDVLGQLLTLSPGRVRFRVLKRKK